MNTNSWSTPGLRVTARPYTRAACQPRDGLRCSLPSRFVTAQSPCTIDASVDLLVGPVAWRPPVSAGIRRKAIMEVPTGKCLTCGKTIPIWRCGDTTGGGTYHIVCFECNQRESRQSGQSSAIWRSIGWILVTGLVMAAFYVVLVFGGH